jgi:hypothetical protein
MNMSSILRLTLLVPATLAHCTLAQFTGPRIDESSKLEMSMTLTRGVGYLLEHQNKDGSWSKDAGITGMCTVALLQQRDNRIVAEDIATATKKAAAYLDGYAKTVPTIRRGMDATDVYAASTSLLALTLVDKQTYKERIASLRKYLAEYVSKRIIAGSMRYTPDELPDIARLHWAIDALHATDSMLGHKRPKGFWQQANRFISDCQSSDPDNEKQYGGFSYSPIKPGGEPVAVWGGLTYAGIKALYFAGVQPTDTRIANGFKWLSQNYSVTVNPGLDRVGYYYYLYLLSSSQVALGIDLQREGKPINWRQDVVDELLETQGASGEWRNTSQHWLENDPALCTAYALIALKLAAAE